RRWIEHVVDDLRTVEDARIDHPMQCRRVAECRQPEETNLALLTQALERRDQFVKHLPDAERRSAAALRNRIVQMKDVDPVKAQHREPHSRAPKDPQLHRCSLRLMWRLCRVERLLLNLSATAGALAVPELTRGADINLKQ